MPYRFFYALLLLFVWNTNTSYSQYTSNRFYVNAKVGYGAFTTRTFQTYGLTANWVIDDRFSLNYNFELLYRNDNVRHFHAPMGLIGGPLLMIMALSSNNSNNNNDGDTTSTGAGIAFLGLLAFVLPEGVSFHQNIGYRGDISPYVNLLGIDFIRDRNTDDRRIKYGCSFGVRASYILAEKFSFSAFIEARKVASVPVGLAGGVQIGYGLGSRD
jgi:hypothetical protein